MKRYVKPARNPKKTLLIILIGGTLMIAIDYIKTQLYKAPPPPKPDVIYAPVPDEVPVGVVMRNVEDPRVPRPIQAVEPDQKDFWEDTSAVKAVPGLKKTRPAIVNGTPKIAIIIDDMGVDRGRSFQVMDLPAPLTLAFLPYAPKLEGITKEAMDKGHELFIHIPMEPMKAQDLGGMGLTVGMSDEAFDQRLEDIFASFDGYVGVNNHMGSKLTQDEAAMHRLMNALQGRGLAFVDSRTIHTSIAEDVADLYGLRHISRDVFLDHVETLEAVQEALAKAEDVAMRTGRAVVIGHPKDVTIEGLTAWIPEAKARGFDLVPVSEVLEHSSPP